MDGKSIFYSIWTLGMSGMFLASTMFAYSPFADGGRAPSRAGMYGPTHK
jgi:cbb3-type cytochrome oxidase subunit 3